MFEVTNQGIITVDTSQLKAEIEQNYKEALGGDLNTDAGTTQGQLITNDINLLTAAENVALEVINSLNIQYGQGANLDLAASFFGYYRKNSVATAVNLVFNGQANVVIPLGFVCSDGTNEYTTLDESMIGATGKVTIAAQNTQPGAIACPANTVTTLVNNLPGIDSVNNPTPGILGTTRESDNQFRTRILQNWLNIRAKTLLSANMDRIFALPNVISVAARENPTGDERVIDGVSLKPHSIFLSILGGNSLDIAATINYTKTPGAAMNGNEVILYTDPDTEQIYQYIIERPAITPIALQVIYRNNNFTPADVETKIIEKILASVADNPFMIGESITSNQFGCLFLNYQFADVIAVKIGYASTGNFADYLQTTLEEIASLTAENIKFEVVNE